VSRLYIIIILIINQMFFRKVSVKFLISVIGLPHDTLRITICSHYIPPTLYNLTLAEYGRSLVEYSRILRVAVDGILLYIAVYCPYIAVVGKTWHNMA